MLNSPFSKQIPYSRFPVVSSTHQYTASPSRFSVLSRTLILFSFRCFDSREIKLHCVGISKYATRFRHRLVPLLRVTYQRWPILHIHRTLECSLGGGESYTQSLDLKPGLSVVNHHWPRPCNPPPLGPPIGFGVGDSLPIGQRLVCGGEVLFQLLVFTLQTPHTGQAYVFVITIIVIAFCKLTHATPPFACWHSTHTFEPLPVGLAAIRQPHTE